MGDEGEYWRDVKQYFKERKVEYRDIFYSSHLPAIERRVRGTELTLKQLSPDHWRISNPSGDWVDFWSTLTFMRKGQKSNFGFKGLERQILALRVN